MCLVALFSIAIVDAQEPRRGERATETIVFDTSIDCAGCARKVNNTIPYERGVKNVEVDLEAKTVTVTGNADVAALKQAIRDADYEVVE